MWTFRNSSGSLAVAVTSCCCHSTRLLSSGCDFDENLTATSALHEVTDAARDCLRPEPVL